MKMIQTMILTINKVDPQKNQTNIHLIQTKVPIVVANLLVLTFAIPVASQFQKWLQTL